MAGNGRVILNLCYGLWVLKKSVIAGTSRGLVKVRASAFSSF
jgi:hypothetical protein